MICERTGADIRAPDLGELSERLLRTGCAFPFQVTLHSITSVCGFSAMNQWDVLKIGSARYALTRYRLASDEDFNGVAIYFCKNTSRKCVVPDRDTIFLHSSLKDVDEKTLGKYLAHEIMHVRQYRREGTDKFKCDYTRSMGSCLASNLNRGVANLVRDGYCQNSATNSYEREAMQFRELQKSNSRSLNRRASGRLGPLPNCNPNALPNPR